MHRSDWVIAIVIAVTAAAASAKIVTQAVAYNHGDVQLEGYLAYDDATDAKRPGVLLVHEWWGLGEHAKAEARRLAELGYVAFACDMYGQGKLTADRKQAAQWAGAVRGTPLLRTRAKAALDVLKAHRLVDPKRVAAIGFCFGGTTVLELAYSGADLAGIVSFHGGLTTPKKTDDVKAIKAKLLICHGADDPHVPAEKITAAQSAWRAAKLDWQMVYYANAVHSFTNPAAGNDNSRGAAYNAAATRRAWGHMKLFFDELFGRVAANRS